MFKENGIEVKIKNNSNEPITNIPTCGIVAVDFEVNKWEDIRDSNYKRLFFDFPKNYKL